MAHDLNLLKRSESATPLSALDHDENIDKIQSGIDYVDNARISGEAATSDALNLKEDKANKGAANGYAPLGANNKVPDANVNISAANATDLTDGGNSPLHYHATDRDRANHTGTQTMSTISDAGTSATRDVGTASDEVAAGNHNHDGVYEPADSTILKDADIGVNVQAYDATILKDADIGVNVQAYDADIVSDGSYVHTDNNYTTVEKNKLAGIESGAETNNISDTNATDLTDGGDTELHTHDSRYFTKIELPTTELTLTNKTLDDITNQIGADHIHYKVRNAAGTTLPVNTVVRASASQPGTDYILVEAVTDPQTQIAIGITHTELAPNGAGLVTNTGVVSDYDTGDWLVGTVLYPSVTGGLTSTRPTEGQYQPCAYVLHQHDNHGVLLVEFTEPVRIASTDQFGYVKLNDTLVSESTSEAVTAKQAKVLQDNKENKLEKGQPNGYAPLNASGVLSTQYTTDNIGTAPSYTALGVTWFDTIVKALKLYNGYEWEVIHLTKFSPAIGYRTWDYSRTSSGDMVLLNSGTTETTNDLLMNAGRAIELTTESVTVTGNYITWFDFADKQFHTTTTSKTFTAGTYNNILVTENEVTSTHLAVFNINPNLVGKLALSETGNIEELDLELANGDAWYPCMEKEGALLVDMRSKEDGASYFISTDTEQAYTMRMPIGASVFINGVEYTGNGNTNVIANVSDIGKIEIKESQNGALTYLNCHGNQLTGSIPNLSSNTNLTTFNCYTNQLTGPIPDLSNNTSLTTFNCFDNQITGFIPDLSSNISLSIFDCGNNQITGSIPDLSSNTSLATFYCANNQLTGYGGGAIRVTSFFRADNNKLTVTAVDAILQGLVDGGTTGTVTIQLNGGTNGIPTNTTAIDTLRSRGCTVTVNGGY